MMERVQLIVNPIAGRGRGVEAARAIEARLGRLGYAPSTFITRRRGDAREFAASLGWRTSRIVVVGGDGTLNEVINGQTKIPLAVFPAGTGNAFATDQGIPGTVEALGGLLRHGVVRWFDLGDAGRRKFLNMAACGILGEIHRIFWETREGPDSLARCLITALSVLRRHRFRPLAVWGDAGLVSPTAGLAVIGNIQTYARWIRFTPRASPFDGVLDICTFPEPSGFDLPRWFLAVLRGRHPEYPGIGYRQSRTIQIGGEGIACHVDGEYVGQAPLTVSVLPRSVPILVPAKSGVADGARGDPDTILSRVV